MRLLTLNPGSAPVYYSVRPINSGLGRFYGNPIEYSGVNSQISNGRSKLFFIHDANFVNPDIHTQIKYREYVDARETKTTSTIWNSRAPVLRHTFPNFDGGTSTGMMTSSIHLCVASLTYMLYNLI